AAPPNDPVRALSRLKTLDVPQSEGACDDPAHSCCVSRANRRPPGTELSKNAISVRATGCALPYTTTTSRNTRRLPFFVIAAKSVQVAIASASVQRPFLHIGRKEILQTKLEHSMGWGITRQDRGS